MIQIDFIFGSTSLERRDSVLIVAKSVLAVLVNMAWSLQLQLDEGGENT
jgi:hypothetical protein